MAHGVEARVPFLDYRLVEFCLGLPEECKIRGAWTKRVLREGMKGVIPESIRKRTDKIGFATAEETWMKQSHRDFFWRALQVSIEQSKGILSPKLLVHAEKMLSEHTPFNFTLWRSISFGAWMEKYNVSVI